MSRLQINIGTEGNDATGDSIREAFRKTNANFTELYTSLGLGDRQRFTNLDDVPASFNDQAGKILAVDAGEAALEFLTVEGAGGINVSTTSQPGKLVITNTRSSIITDTTPQLGGDLNAGQKKIYNLADPLESQDAVNKRSAVMKAGDTMTGPLILSRSPIVTDDVNYNGLIAATKRYVDNSSYVSTVNFYVSTSGTDYRSDLPENKRGRFWSYAFRTIQRAAEAAEAVINATPLELGPYQKTLTYDGGNSETQVVSYIDNADGTFSLSLYTKSLRTDFENDLRPGLYLRGSGSGALARIVTVNTSLSGDNEVFLVTPVTGTFRAGETVQYSDAVQAIQITILVESGIYEENFPIKIPPNVSIVGDEFRRVMIRPKGGVSASPWINSIFRRDKTFDGIRLTDYVGSDLSTFTTVTPSALSGTITVTLGSGTTSAQWVGGFFRASQGQKFAEGVITSVSSGSFTVVLHDEFITLTAVPARSWTVYQTQTYGRHYITDITKPIYPVINYGDHVNAARLLTLNKAFIQAEVVAYLDVTFASSTAFSYDRQKCQRDVELILEAVTADMVLGSNYRSVVAGMAYLRSYSSTVTSSQKAQTIAGISKAKQLAIAKTANSDAIAALTSSFNTVIRIITNGLASVPANITNPYPSSLSNPKRYAAELLNANKAFIKNEVTAYLGYVANTAIIPNYSAETCERDVGYVLDALIYDLIYDGNSQTVAAALAYVDGTGTSSAIAGEESYTITAFTRMKDVVQSIARDVQVSKTTINTTKPNTESQVRKVTLNITDPLTDITASDALGANMTDLLTVIGSIDVTSPYTTAPTVPTIVEPTFTSGASELQSARTFILGSKTSISGDSGVIGFLDARYGGAFTYNREKCSRDVGIVVDAMCFDLRYGGGNRTIAAALTYYQAAAALVLSDQLYETTAAYTYLGALATTLVTDPLTELPVYPGSGSHNGYRYQGGAIAAAPQVYPKVTSTIISFNSTTRKITSSNFNIVNFVDAGFIAGDVIEVSGTVNNNGSFTISAVTETTLTLSSLDTLTTEAEGRSVTIINNITVNAGSTTAISELTNAILGVINNDADYNPPKENNKLDVFLMNDATMIRNLTFQGHGGFTMVLDPEGQIRTKSPYAQTCSSMSRSVNSQIFTGGQFVDGFAGNIVAAVTGGTASNPQTDPASYTSITVSGLTRQPQTPCVFFISGTSYTVTTVSNYNIANGTATINLSETVPIASVSTVTAGSFVAGKIYTIQTLGNTDFTLIGALSNTVGLTFIATGVGTGSGTARTTLELITAGNRSMLSNDFTQVNDMGYGLVATNNGLIEAVSVFTYYCYTAYYSLNGGQIRSLNGSCAYGVNALKAEGSDPLEVPDDVTLKYDLVQTANVWIPVTMTMSTAITGTATIGNTVTQASSGMSGTIVEVNTAKTTLVVLPTLPRVAGQVVSVTGGTNTGTITSSTSGTVNFSTFAVNQYVTISGTVSNDGTYKIGAIVNGLFTGSAITLSQKFNADTKVWSSTFTTVTESAGSYVTIAVTGTFLTTSSDTLASTGWTNTPYPTTASSDYAANAGGLSVYVDSAQYLPNNLSELEITFTGGPGGQNRMYRYEVASSAPLLTVIPTAVGAGSFIVGQKYTIVTIGDSVSFTTIGAASNTVGVSFIASGVGASGIGTATLNDSIRNNSTSIYKLNISSGSGAKGLEYALYHGQYVTIRQNRTLWLSGLQAVSAVRPSTALVLNDQPTAVYRVLSFTLVNIQSGTYVWSGITARIDSSGHNLITGDAVLVSFAGGDHGDPNTALYTVTVINSNVFDITIGSANGSGYDSAGTAAFSKTTGEGYANLREPYGQIIVNDYSGAGYPASHGGKNDTQIACVALGLSDVPRIVGMKFAWYNTVHTITGYLPPGLVGGTTDSGNLAYGRLTFTPALTAPFQKALGNFDSYTSVRAVQVAGEGGNISVNISTMRATGHDMLAIGTGSYADSNYPNNIYGPPITTPASSKEVQEIGKGRVFYVSTDQDGNFKVGEFFKVDQGTGTVTFSASIALSNLNGLGFKRGVAISEFSTDDTMADNAPDTVPTEAAVRGYIDKRLGITHTGGITPSSTLIPTNGGFIDRKGLLAMNGVLRMGGNVISALGDPVADGDAVPYSWLTFGKLRDFDDNNIQSGDLLVMTGQGTRVTNAAVTGPVTFNLTAGDSSTPQIRTEIGSNTITDANISNQFSDRISLAKLNIPNAGQGTSSSTAVKGLASFNSTQFTAENGFVSFTGTVAINKLGTVDAKTVLGNNNSGGATPYPVAMSDVVISGGGIRKSDFTTTGLMNVSSAPGSVASTFTNIPVAETWASGDTTASVVKRDSNGDFSARTITVGDGASGGLKLLDAAGVGRPASSGVAMQRTNRDNVSGRGSHTVKGYNAHNAIIIQDDSSSTTYQKTFYNNTEHIFGNKDGSGAGTINVQSGGTITTGSETTGGSITGRWTLTGSSRLEATYADLAEYYSADREYPVGWVMMFGGSAEVTAANINATTRVAGVVSTDPAYIMNTGLEGIRVCLALQGRVPCRVVGKIKKGDLIIASDMIGVAVSAGENARAGSIIGKALADYDSDHIGLIEVAVGRL